MLSVLTASPLFGIVLCILTFRLGVWLHTKTKRTLFHPTIVANAICISILLLFQIPYSDFNRGGQLLSLFIAPATAVIAMNIYKQRALLARYPLPILGGCFVGSATSLASVYGLCRLMGLNDALLFALLPKSCTTAIAMGLTESCGGIVAISIVAVIVTGTFGGLCARSFARLFHIHHPVAEGLAIGASSHVMGTSIAIEIGETQGALSGLAIGICGLYTVILMVLFF